MPIGFTTEHELALEAFSSDSYLQVNKTLLKIYGLEMAVFICNLVDKLKYFRNRDMLTEDGGFFLTHADQTEQISLSDHQLRKCKQKCRELGILTTKMVGIPPKEFYFLNIERLVEVFKEYSLKNLRNDPLKIKGMSLKKLSEYKETKSKETKSKETKSSLSDKEFLSDENIKVKQRKRNTPPTSETKQSIPYEEIKDAWNIITKDSGLSQVTKITSSRQKHIQARFSDLPSVSDWKKLFRQVIQSPFLCGDNNRGWICSFDWLIQNDTNLIKVIEGKYSKQTPKKNGTRKTTLHHGERSREEIRDNIREVVKTRGKVLYNDPVESASATQ